jgi:hypothetical protein
MMRVSLSISILFYISMWHIAHTHIYIYVCIIYLHIIIYNQIIINNYITIYNYMYVFNVM